MSLLRYLKPVTSLPTAEQTDLPAITLKKANEAVQDALGHVAKIVTNRKRKYTITFTPEDQNEKNAPSWQSMRHVPNDSIVLDYGDSSSIMVVVFFVP